MICVIVFIVNSCTCLSVLSGQHYLTTGCFYSLFFFPYLLYIIVTPTILIIFIRNFLIDKFFLRGIIYIHTHTYTSHVAKEGVFLWREKCVQNVGNILFLYVHLVENVPNVAIGWFYLWMRARVVKDSVVPIVESSRCLMELVEIAAQDFSRNKRGCWYEKSTNRSAKNSGLFAESKSWFRL